MAHQTILVLDFGSQFTQLIARRLRELSVYCEILPFNTPLAAIKAKQPIGIILSGGPSSVDEEGAPHIDRAVLDLGVPTLGVCYGMQLMTHMLGGTLGPLRASRVRPRARAPRHRDLVAHAEGHARRNEGVGEPRRLRRHRAAGIRRRRHQQQRAGRRDGSAGARLLRAAVSSGGGAHRSRQGAAAQLRVRRLRLHRRLDHRVVHRRGHRAHQGAGRQRPRRVRPVGRRRFNRRRLDHPSRDRRSPAVHLRRQRPASPQRSAAGGRALQEAAAAGASRRCERDVPRSPRRRHRSRAEAQDHRQDVHRRLQRQGAASSATSISWRRARSIRTSSNRSRCAGRRRRSRAITTSAACPKA